MIGQLIAVRRRGRIVTPPPVPPPPVGAGTFVATAGRIYDSAGNVFVPIGANLGTQQAFDWKGTAPGHSADAVKWGWNFVRLSILGTDSSSFSYLRTRTMAQFLAYLDSIITEYTSKGIIIMLACHEQPKDPAFVQSEVEAKLVAFWAAAAAKWKSNPRVWFNLLNEPRYQNDDWVNLHRTLGAAVRGTGNTAPIVVDAPIVGQDVGPRAGAGFKYSYEPDMAPVLQNELGNLIVSSHVYGGWSAYNTEAKLTAYVNTMRAAGLTPFFGEYGYRWDVSTGADWTANVQGATAVFAVAPALGVGTAVWHGTHGDNYSLTADGRAFWNADPPTNTNTSDLGRGVWALAHGVTPPPPPQASSALPFTLPFTLGV